MRFSTRFLAFTFAVLGLGGAIIAQQAPVKDEPKPEATPAPETAPVPEAVHSQFTLLPMAFTSFGAAPQGGYLYVIGGHTAPAHHYYREGFQTGFWRLSLADRASWEQLPGGVSLQSVALVSDGARVIRVGGMTARNAEKEKDDLHSTAEVAAYDPLARAWTNLPALPEVRSSHDAVVHDGKLYVFGGWKLDGASPDETPWHKGGLVLDLAAKTPQWDAVEQPFQKRALALASAGGRIYAIGGMTSDGKMSSGSNLYDPAKKEWSEGPALPGSAFGAFGSSAYGLNGRAYVTTSDGLLFSHAPGEAAWKREGALSIPRMFHRLVAAGDELAAIAGTTRGGHLRTIEWLKPGLAAPVLTSVSIPAPGSARVRQGIFSLNGSLYVFGGNNSSREHQFKPENFLDEAYRINLTNLTCTKIAGLPVKRQSFATFVTGTGRDEDPQGYALGGFGFAPEAKAAASQGAILKYDFEVDRWETLDVKLPSPMTQFGYAVNAGKVYLFGGMDFDPARGEKKQFQVSDRIWAWDRESKDEAARKEFRPLETRLSKARRAYAGAELGGKFYIVGGMTENFGELPGCEAFNFATGKCEAIPSPSASRIAAKLVPLAGKLYLIGGSVQADAGLEVCQRIEAYDPETKKWSVVVDDLGFDPGELQVFAIGQSLVIYSAHNDDGKVNLVFMKP